MVRVAEPAEPPNKALRLTSGAVQMKRRSQLNLVLSGPREERS
jgi:hypothetical protein